MENYLQKLLSLFFGEKLHKWKKILRKLFRNFNKNSMKLEVNGYGYIGHALHFTSFINSINFFKTITFSLCHCLSVVLTNRKIKVKKKTDFMKSVLLKIRTCAVVSSKEH